MPSTDRKRAVAAQTGIYLLVLAAIAVVANAIAAGLYARWDWTKAERYTLSQGSARLVSSLKKPMYVDAYVTKGLPRLDAFVRDLTDLLKEYERGGQGKFKFTVTEANTDELREKAKEAGLSEMAFGETSATGEDQASITQGFMGLVFKYGSEKGVIPQLNPHQAAGMEFWVTNKIREIQDKEDQTKHRIAVISGKDELGLGDTNLVAKQGGGQRHSIKSILQNAFPFYQIEELDLKGGEEQIDPEFDGAMITQPRKDYTEKELRRIDEFLMRGSKSLAVFASAVTLKPQDPTMMATLSLHGLDKLLVGYGLDLKKNAVFDHGAQFRIGIRTITGKGVTIRHPGIAHVVNDPRYDEEERLLDNSFPAFFRMEEVAFPFPSSIELLRDKQPNDVKLYPVARTTEHATVETDGSVNMKMRAEWNPKPPYSQRIIAAVAEGPLKSAFAGTPNPEGIKPNERAPRPSRVLLVASSLFLTNPFAYAGNGPEFGHQFQMMGAVGGDRELMMIANPYAQAYLTGTILAVKNTLDWMSGDADLLAASAKLLMDPNLTYSDVSKPEIEGEPDEATLKKLDEEYRTARQNLQTKVQWSLTLGVPLLFAGLGVGRWRFRRSKKAQKKL
jgi:ABC-type uncharacterized transport system involved in gliding motility auxiliary subunit